MSYEERVDMLKASGWKYFGDRWSKVSNKTKTEFRLRMEDVQKLNDDAFFALLSGTEVKLSST